MKEKITREEFLKLKEEIVSVFTEIAKISDEPLPEDITVNDEDYAERKEAFEQDLQTRMLQKFDEYRKILERVTTFDLSDIPFEDWNGVILLTNKTDSEYPTVEMDFSDTFANLDFSIVQAVGDNFKFHSCNIVNLDKTAGNIEISREIFDEEVVRENESQFISEDLPSEVRRRFFAGRLEVADVVQYEEIFRKSKGRISLGAEVFERISWEEVQKIDLELVRMLPDYTFPNIELVEGEEVTAEKFNQACLESIRDDIINNGERPNKEYSEKFRTDNPDLIFRDDMPELYDEGFGRAKRVDLKTLYEHADKLKGKSFMTEYPLPQFLKIVGEDIIDYLVQELTHDQANFLISTLTQEDKNADRIRENIDFEKLRTLEFPERFATLRALANTRMGEKTELLSQAIDLKRVMELEKIKFAQMDKTIHDYGLENLIAIGGTDFESLKSLRAEKSLEKIREYSADVDIAFFLENGDSKVDIDAFRKYGIDFYLQRGYTTISDVTSARFWGINLPQMKELTEQGIGLDALLNNQELLDFINAFGIDNILRLNEESENMFDTDPGKKSDKLLSIATAYKFVEEKREKTNEEILYEDFIGEIVKAIRVAREKKIRLPEIEKISPKVKEKIPEEFLSREELAAVYDNPDINHSTIETTFAHFQNGTLTTEYIFYHPEIIPVLAEKNLANAIKLSGKIKTEEKKEYIPARTAEGTYIYVEDVAKTYKPINITQYICERFGNEFLLNLCKDFSSVYLKDVQILVSGDETPEKMLEIIDNVIVQGIKKDRQFTHDKLNPEFQKRHPELFLDYDVNETIKSKFYRKSLDMQDLKDPQTREALEGKDIALGAALYFSNKTEIKSLFESVPLQDFYSLIDEYGRYLEKVRLPNLYSITSQENYMETLKSALEAAIEKNVLVGETNIGEDVPKFLKEKYPQYFIEDLDLEDRKKYYAFNGEATFTRFFEAFQGEKLKAFEGKDITINFKMKTVYGLPSYSKFFEKFSMEEILGKFSEYGPAIDRIVSAKKVDLLRKAYDKHGEIALKAPELICAMTDEELETINFSQYLDLVKKSNFHLNKDYRKENAERLVAKMYLFLGYDNTAEIFRIPEMSKEELVRAIEEKEEEFDQACEVRFTLKGDIKIVTDIFRKLDLTQYQKGNKKIQFEIFKNINMNLENGFEGSFEELLSDSISKAGCVPNEEHLKSFSKYINGLLTTQKLEQANPYLIGVLNENLTATGANRKIILDIFNAEIRKNLLENGNINQEQLIENLRKEILERKKEDGSLYYSPQVRDHFDALEKTVVQIKESPEISSIFSISPVDCLKREREKIGNGWIRKVLNVPSELSLEEIESLENKLYGTSEEKSIEFSKRVVIKSKSKGEKPEEKAYTLMESLENPLIMTIPKAEIIFDGIDRPYSQEFVRFFMANRKEILQNPKLYTKVTKLHGEFESLIGEKEIKNRYDKGLISVDQMFELLENNAQPYGIENEGDWELSRLARVETFSERKFGIAQKILQKMKEREYQTVPPVKDRNVGRFRGRILRSDDPLHIVIGDITTCCQHVGGYGETSMLHSALEKNGSLFVVEELDEFGNVVNTVAQSWTWRNNDVVCFDNVEIPDTMKEELSMQDYEDITAAYQEAAKAMIRTDAKLLKKMLDEGKITQIQYDEMVIKEVTVGTGCNDLRTLNMPGRFKRPKKSTLPFENRKTYLEYRDPEGDGREELYTDATYTFSFANIQDVEGEIELMPRDTIGITHEKDDLLGVPKGYGKTRETLIHKGNKINPDDLKAIERIRRTKSPNDKYRFEGLDSTLSIAESLDVYESELRLLISRDEEWYILGVENEDSIQIVDAVRNPKETAESLEGLVDKVAGLEMASGIYGLILEADAKDKRLIISNKYDSSGINLESLAEKGLIGVSGDRENKIITLKERGRLEEELKQIKGMLAKYEETILIEGVDKNRAHPEEVDEAR